jgi:glycosyltransferase involved in cell wall biosynthesis
VFFLGAKTTDALGAYVQHFDVCLMPYRQNDYTKYIYPLKLHEYLASGRPVVSSPIRTVEDFREVLCLASSPAEWSRMIERALSDQENTPARRAERQKIAQAHDWDLLVEHIAATMARRLALPFPRHGSESAEWKSVPELMV